MTKGFDEVGFMSYLNENFTGFENSFLRELVENIIKYAHQHEQVSLDQFCYFLSDMIPEITFGEVAQFMDDKCLTTYGKNEKYKRKEI